MRRHRVILTLCALGLTLAGLPRAGAATHDPGTRDRAVDRLVIVADTLDALAPERVTPDGPPLFACFTDRAAIPSSHAAAVNPRTTRPVSRARLTQLCRLLI